MENGSEKQQHREVEITTEPGISTQFGKQLSYSQKRIFSKKLLTGLGVALLLCVLLLVIVSPNQPAREGPLSAFIGIDPEVETLQVPFFHVPAAVSSGSTSQPKQETSSSRRKARPASPKPVVSYLGPESIRRPKRIMGADGVVVEAILTTGASNGVVHAKLKENLVAHGEVLAEEGTLLVGQGQSGEERLIIRFHKAVFSDGTSAKISAQALDSEDQIPGIKGSKVGQHGLRLATGIGLNFVGGVSEALQDYDGEDGALVRRPTLKNALLHGSARAALDHSQETLGDLRNEPTLIEVPRGSTIHVAFEGGNDDDERY